MTSNVAARAWGELSEEEQAAALVQGAVTDRMLSEEELASVLDDTLTVAETDDAFAWIRAALDEFAAMVTANWQDCVWIDSEERVEIVRSGTFEGLRVHEIQTRDDTIRYWTANVVEEVPAAEEWRDRRRIARILVAIAAAYAVIYFVVMAAMVSVTGSRNRLLSVGSRIRTLARPVSIWTAGATGCLFSLAWLADALGERLAEVLEREGPTAVGVAVIIAFCLGALGAYLTAAVVRESKRGVGKL